MPDQGLPALSPNGEVQAAGREVWRVGPQPPKPGDPGKAAAGWTPLPLPCPGKGPEADSAKFPGAHSFPPAAAASRARARRRGPALDPGKPRRMSRGVWGGSAPNNPSTPGMIHRGRGWGSGSGGAARPQWGQAFAFRATSPPHSRHGTITPPPARARSLASRPAAAEGGSPVPPGVGNPKRDTGVGFKRPGPGGVGFDDVADLHAKDAPQRLAKCGWPLRRPLERLAMFGRGRPGSRAPS